MIDARWLPFAVLLLALLAAACQDGTEPVVPDPIRIEVEGRPERGLEVALRATTPAGTPVEGVQWSATPAGAVALLAGDRARLLEAGPVTLTATADGVTAHHELDIALPPRIVFEAPGAPGRTLYQARLDGRELAPLPVGPGESLYPTTAPGVVVFVNFRHGNAELFRLQLASDAVDRLTDTAADEIQPALSPDGSRLAFVRMVGGLPHLYLAGPDATGAVRAAPGHGDGATIEGSPSWSPAGDRVAFMSTAGGRAGIHVLTTATGQVTPLLTGARTYVEPAWSPDGGRLAFVSSIDGQTALFLLDLETGQETRLTHGTDTAGHPAWLPDGRLVFTAWTGTTPALRWIDPDHPDRVHPVPVDLDRAERPAAVR